MSWLLAVGPGELMAIGSSIAFAVAQGFTRQGMRSASPLAAALFVNTTVSLFGLAVSLWRGTLQASTLEPILWYVAVGCAGPGLGRITFYIGIIRMGLSRSVTISSATPIWGTMIAMAALGESPTAMVLFGTLGIVSGVGLLSLEGDSAQSFRDWFRGALIFPLTASLAYALPPVFAKFAYAHQPTPAVGMAVAFMVGNLVLLAAKPLLPDGGRIHADRAALRAFAVAGVLGMISSFLLWTAFTVASVSTALPLSRIAPIWVLVISYLFLRQIERINARAVVATVLVVLGGVLITAFRS